MELKSLLFSSKTNGVDTALNFNGRNEELAGSEAEDDDEWEFKDANAPSQVNHGNEKVTFLALWFCQILKFIC